MLAKQGGAMSDTGSSEHGKALSALGASKGGVARAKKLSKEKRAAIAQVAALTRWEKSGKEIRRAVFGNEDRPIRIGDASIPAYVLDDSTRVLAFRGLQVALGFHPSGGGGAARMTQMLERIGVTGNDYNDLTARLRSPIRFYLPQGGPPAHGYEATVLADICEAVLAARKAGDLPKGLQHIADQCEILVRGFARVGIIALVDEATGYQDIRARDALASILEAFVTKELKKWVKTFQADFYKEIFRLNGWDFPPKPPNKPQWRPAIVGQWTNDIVYERLAPGVLAELQKLNPIDEKGRRKYKLFQFLTDDIGHPRLREHLSAVIAIMRICDSWQELMVKLDRALPKWGVTGLLPVELPMRPKKAPISSILPEPPSLPPPTAPSS
jgi:hypothetical protein